MPRAPSPQRVAALIEEQVAALSEKLMRNEAFLSAGKRLLTGTLKSKASLDRNLQLLLGMLNVPTLDDVRRLTRKLDDLEEALTELEAKLATLERRASKNGAVR